MTSTTTKLSHTAEKINENLRKQQYQKRQEHYMNSRLACQARVLGEGVFIERSSGMYFSQIDNITDDYVGL